jgi:hypothetical protein
MVIGLMVVMAAVVVVVVVVGDEANFLCDESYHCEYMTTRAPFGQVVCHK